jgi:hypothetical protein
VDFRPPVADISFDKLTLAWGDRKTEVALIPTATIAPVADTPPAPEGATESATDTDEPSLIEKALSIFRRPRQEGLQVGFKALGNGRWMATFTNNFEDRQRDILAEKAHDRYIGRLDNGLVPMPVLRHWHIAGSEHGVAEWVGRAGHMVIAIGRFDNTPQGRAAEKSYLRHPDRYAVSHKFLYPSWAEKAGVIEDYNAYEISTAPRGAEVNPYTGFTTIQEDAMPLSPDKQASLRDLFKDEKAFQAAMESIQAIEAQGDRVAQLAVKFKTFADVTPAPSVPVTEVPADLLLIVLEGQKTLAEGWDMVEKALEGMKTQLDADTVTDEKAAEIIRQQAAGTQFDPRYPGMQVPLPSGN